MKLKYEINLFSLGTLVAVALAIAFAGVSAINQVTNDLNEKLMANEVRNLIADVRGAHQVLRDSGVEKVASYIDRAKRDLMQEFSKYKFGKTGRLWIVDLPRGAIVYGQGTTGDLANAACLAEMIRAKTGSLNCTHTSGNHLYNFGVYPEWNWMVVLSVETREILEARDKFLRNVVIILLASLVAGAMLFLWFTERLVRPIRQLAAAAASVSRGEWDAPLPDLKGDGEVAQLARIFSQMSFNLAESYQKLQENFDQVARSREELQQSREQFRSLVETTSDWVWETDADGIYTYVSPRVLDLLGYQPEEVVGKKIVDLMPIAASNRSTVMFAGILGSASSFAAIEKICVSKRGEEVVLESSGVPFYDPDGVFLGYRGIDRDITQRMRSENAFRNLILNAPIGIFIIQDGCFKLVNPGVLEITGYAERELIGCEALAGVSPELAEMVRDCDFAANGNERPSPFEFRITTKNGATRWVMQTETPTLHNGQPATLGFFIDVTELKRAAEERERLQAQLTQAQKMEAVGRLAGGVAHDFNNMLGVILGHTELAMNRLDAAHPLYSSLKNIHTAAERSADLTRQLLAFARKQTVAPKVLDLNQTIEGMVNMLTRLIGEDIDLAWLPGRNLGAIKMDPSQIDQILVNLCVNARDAIGDTGKVTIETNNAACDAAYCATQADFVPGEYVLLAVSDNGCGMHPETVSHLFEPFFTTKGTGKGTGLGLATVYGIVKQNNGFINVYSEPSQGTTFKVYLPLHATKAEQTAQTGAAEPAARGHETILLVEDELLLLDMTKDMLEIQGYTVLPAATPGEAIRLAREHAGDIHLLMTDVVMPEMNGRDLAKNLLALYPNLNRLFMSGYTANVIAHHGVLEEGVHFIQKPFTMNDLSVKIREVLDVRNDH